MLIDFFLDILKDPSILPNLKKNRDDVLGRSGLSREELDAVKAGSIHSLRSILLRQTGAATPASDYTVSTSGDTPHCPVAQHVLFDASFWRVTDPDDMWDFGGLTIVG